MRPLDVQRELERSIVEAATARARLTLLRERLSAARVMIDEVRRALGSDGSPETPTERTPAAPEPQGEAAAAAPTSPHEEAKAG